MPLPLELGGHPFDPFEARSEDVRFSPSGRLLAVVTTQGRVLLFALDRQARPLRATLLTQLVSSQLHNPHGVDWLDERTLLVANRSAGLSCFRIPAAATWGPETPLRHRGTLQSRWFGAPGELRDLPTRRIRTGPGSVRIHGQHAWVACNKANTVTRHRIRQGRIGHPPATAGTPVVAEGLNIPDSVAVSADGTWLAVGDHGHHRVALFRTADGSPCGELRDPELLHPHGVAISRCGTVLIAGDAGGRGLFLFHAPDGSWERVQTAASSMVEGVSAEVFERVQAETPEIVRDLEGGSKGVDLATDGRLLVTSCRGQTLRCFALDG